MACRSNDPDVIVRVYAVGWASVSIVNDHLRRQGLPIPDEIPYRRGSRESTAEPEQDMPFFELRFSQGPKTKHGFVFGAHSGCDVRMDIQGVSNSHFALDFDVEDHLVVRDLESRNGTTVVYGNKKYKRKDFQWIVGGDPEIESINIRIKLHNGVAFLIMPTIFNPGDQDHAGKVRRFREGSESANSLPSSADERRRRHSQDHQPTEPASEKATPIGSDWVFVELGSIAAGAQGTVTHVWNATTGRCYARKTSTIISAKGEKAWRRELKNLLNSQHPHVVPLRHFSDHRVLFMDFYRLGSLDKASKDQPLIAADKNHTLAQCLDALSYLHNQKVTHRDIKPANILVARREPAIHVLLSDFGLSKEGSQLFSHVGTPRYFAPEMVGVFDHLATPMDQSGSTSRSSSLRPSKRKKQSAHTLPPDQMFPPKRTNAMDVWSLGVVGLWMSQALPTLEEARTCYERRWFDTLVATAQAYSSNGRGLLVQRMLVIDPNKRISSRECLVLSREVLDLGHDDDDAPVTRMASTSGSDIPPARLSTPVPASESGLTLRRSDAPSPSREGPSDVSQHEEDSSATFRGSDAPPPSSNEDRHGHSQQKEGDDSQDHDSDATTPVQRAQRSPCHLPSLSSSEGYMLPPLAAAAPGENGRRQNVGREWNVGREGSGAAEPRSSVGEEKKSVINRKNIINRERNAGRGWRPDRGGNAGFRLLMSSSEESGGGT